VGDGKILIAYLNSAWKVTLETINFSCAKIVFPSVIIADIRFKQKWCNGHSNTNNVLYSAVHFLRTVHTTWCTAIKQLKKTSKTFDPLALLDTSLVNTCINEQSLLDCTQRSVLQLLTDSVISLCHEMLPAPGSMQGLWYAFAHSTRALLLQSWFYTTDAIRYPSVYIHIKISSWTCSTDVFPPQPVVREMRLNSRRPRISVPFLGTFAQIATSAYVGRSVCSHLSVRLPLDRLNVKSGYKLTKMSGTLHEDVSACYCCRRH